MPSIEKVLEYYLTLGSAGIVIFAGILLLWRFLWKRFPSPIERFTTSLPAAVVFPLLYLAHIGGLIVDAWYHIAVGRDNFFVPPHLFVIGAITATFLLAAIQIPKVPAGHRFWFYSILLWVAAYSLGFAFDDTTHRLFGPENISSALIFFSPPHFFLGTSKLFIGFAIASVLRRISPHQLTENEKMLLMLFTFGVTFAGTEYLFLPLEPYVSYQILGAYGSLPLLALLGFAFSMMLWYFPRTLGAGTFIVAVGMLLSSFRESNYASPFVQQPIGPMPHIYWVLPASFLLAAVTVDVLRRLNFRPVVTGFAFGLAQTLVFHPLHSFWFFYREVYNNPIDPIIIIPIILGAIGGSIGFLLADRAQRYLSAVYGKSHSTHEATAL